MQGNWTVCVPLKHLIFMPDIQEAKCFEFTVQILPPPPRSSQGAANMFCPPRFISVYALANPPSIMKFKAKKLFVRVKDEKYFR